MADDLYFYPETERAPHRDKPKGPYVKFLKRKRHHLGSQRKDDQPEFIERDEVAYYPITSAPNVEAIENFRRTEARVIGFGNFPKRAPYGTIRKHLLDNTELMFDNPDNATRKHLEAKIREEIAAELASEVAAIESGEATENPAKRSKREKAE